MRSHRVWRLSFILLGVLVAGKSQSVTGQEAVDFGPTKIDATEVARLPAPGTVVPGAIAFAPDGKSVTYLKAESASLNRVLWRADVASGQARVIARPHGSGDTDATVSREEALRRERQRLRETGITQISRAKNTDIAVIPLAGDLFLLKGDGPLERLTTTAEPELDPKLSPDGSQVAFVRSNELFRIDLAARVETQLTHGAIEGVTHGLAEFMAQEEMDRSTGFWWSPDGSMIAYQETDERQIPLYSIVHQGGTEPNVETYRYPFPGAKNAQVRLGVVSARGGETTWLKLPVPESGDFYLARVDWADPNSLLIQILARDQKSLTLVRYNLVQNKSVILRQETAATWVNLHHDLKVVESTGEIVWSTERSGNRQLVLLAKDGSEIRELTPNRWPVDGLIQLDKSRREVWFESGTDQPLGRQTYRVSLDGGDVIPITSEPGTHRVSVASDGEHYVDVFSSRTQPPTTRLMTREGRFVAELDSSAEYDPRVKTFSLVSPEMVSFSSRDGIALWGAFYKPKSAQLGIKAPLVVLLYGGPHVQYVTDSWSLTADLNAQALAERGFAVWKMDNRGSARRGHRFEEPIHRAMGQVEVRDQEDGVRFVSNHFAGLVDSSRVGVCGSSYGGYMTLRCLTEAPLTFHAGVAIAPVTEWDRYDTCYTERYMETPATNPEGYQDSSVLTHANQLVGSLLIVHGMIDENVHFRHSARLVEALIQAERSFDLLPLPSERHSSRKEVSRKYLARRLFEFLEQKLGSQH